VDKVGLHDHLLAREQSVGDELAGSDGDLGVSHGCGCNVWRGGNCLAMKSSKPAMRFDVG
jgi:hypothetical protein